MKNFLTPLTLLVTSFVLSPSLAWAQFEVNLQNQSLEAEFKMPSGRLIRYSSLSGWSGQNPYLQEVMILNSGGALEKWTFTYSPSFELIIAKSLQRQFNFSYNSLGQLIEIKDSDNCRIKLRSYSLEKNRRITTEAESVSSCPNQTPLKKTETYFYKQPPDSDHWILEKVVATEARKQVTFEINPVSGEIKSWNTARLTTEKMP